MLGNDISNKQAPYVMFDIDSLLFKEPDEEKLWDRLKKYFKSEDQSYLDRDFNKTFIKALNRIWANHNVCIGLVTFQLRSEKYVRELEDRLTYEFAPFTRVFSFENWEELRDFSHSIYTFTDNEELISFMSKKEVLKFREIWGIFK